MVKIFVHDLFQNIISDHVGISGNLTNIHSRSRDQRRTLCNVTHPLIKLFDLSYLWCTDRIKDLRFSRDHIRSNSACVRDRTMNSRCVDHMLSHIIHANVHDLNGIQRRTSKLRRSRRMGGNSMEGKEHTEIGKKFIVSHCFVRRAWMPGDSDITVIEISVPDQICLSARILLRRTAIVADRSLQIFFFHIGL